MLHSIQQKYIYIFLCIIIHHSSYILPSDRSPSLAKVRNTYGYTIRCYKITEETAERSRARASLGITPLHCVKTMDEAEAVMRYGPDINAQDINKLTPIDYMIIHGRSDIVAYLKYCGATIKDVSQKELQQIQKKGLAAQIKRDIEEIQEYNRSKQQKNITCDSENIVTKKQRIK